VDPDLLATVPREILAACGMDALAQVLEPYLSRNASPLTDPHALRGIRSAGRHLVRLVKDPENARAREGMALTSLLGGICLANAGLGAVHGFASPLGALHPIGHGVCCGALLVEVVEANLEASQGTEAGERVWTRFSDVAEALTAERFGNVETAARAGLDRLREIRRELQIPRLGDLGVGEEHVAEIVAGARGSSMRYNPISLTDEQLAGILRRAL